MLRYKLIVLLIIFSLKVTAQRNSDTIRIYFDTGKKEFTNRSAKLLDSLFYNDLVNTERTAYIIGYTDYVGDKEYNDKLSMARAGQVSDYIKGMGFKTADIKLCVGKGEVQRAARSSDGSAMDRRVDLVMQGREPQAQKATPPRIPIPVKARINKLSTLATVKPGQTMVLDKIYFHAGRHFVREESLPELDNLYNVLLDEPTMRIQIEGHICCVKAGRDALDEDTFELALSENRAKFIYEYLVRKGIKADRLAYRGFARTRPVVDPERTAEDEDKNRRVEIRVLQ